MLNTDSLLKLHMVGHFYKFSPVICNLSSKITNTDEQYTAVPVYKV